MTHFANARQKIVEEEGEGLVMRKKDSPYVHGRTELLLKVKVIKDCGVFLLIKNRRTETLRRLLLD